MSSVAGSFADFSLTIAVDSPAWLAASRYATRVDRRLPPAWRKPAIVGVLTCLMVAGNLLVTQGMTWLVVVAAPATAGLAMIAAVADPLKKKLSLSPI